MKTRAMALCRRTVGGVFAGLALLCVVLMLAPAQAAENATRRPAASVSSPRASVSLLAENAVARPGETFWLGLHFKLAPGWHVYWSNPGDSGYPPLLTWSMPEGVTAGAVLWPAPRRIAVGPLLNFGYLGEVLLAVPVEVPADYTGRHLPLELAAEWLVCEESCLPEEGRFALELPIESATTAAPRASESAPLFTAQRRAVPRGAPPAGWQVAARVVAGQVVFTLKAPKDAPVLRAGAFFPFAEGLMQAAAEQGFRVQAGTYALTLSGSDTPTAEWTTLAGVFVGQADALDAPPLAFAFDTPIIGAGPGAIRPAPAAGSFPDVRPVDGGDELPPASFWLALGLAFVGGALLNLMPCVFPLLSLKLLALVRTKSALASDPAAPVAMPSAAPTARYAGNLRHALCYAFGVVLSFLALAGLLIALRAGGAELGWGFQLQSPVFVAAMAMLFFVLGLSLSGALPMATLAQDVPGAWRLRHPLVDALASGVLAVLVASPCTAPLMGVALGAAFVLPAAQTLLVFFVLGVGMALPYALLAVWPGALSRVPKPGAWMARLKEFLAFPLYATVVWLAWVLVAQVGAAGLALLGAALLVVALLAWLLAWVAPRGRLIAVALAFFVVGGLFLELAALEAPVADGVVREPRSGGEAAAWEAWSPAAVAAARATGQGVFVDFTAAWCITCQVNKRLVLNRQAVLDDLARADVRPMRADWTRRDPEISAELTRLGRSGVPVYALYPPRGAPILLSEVLTHDAVRTALDRLATPAARLAPAAKAP